jgi:hypothetical protein
MRERRARTTALLLFSLVLASGPGCDLPPEAAHDGPRVIGVEPVAGTPLDRAASIRLWTDRRVDPASLDGAGIALGSGDVQVGLFLEADPVGPSVLVTPMWSLEPDVDYTLRVSGLRDLDGHVGPDEMPVVLHTGWAERGDPVVPPPDWGTIRNILGGCAGGGCHGRDAASGIAPVLGLELADPTSDAHTAELVRTTLLDVPAVEVDPAVRGMSRASSRALSGMRRVAVGDPSRSYVIYKLLGDEHIVGSPMPRFTNGLDLADVELVARWIRAGAPTNDSTPTP